MSNSIRLFRQSHSSVLKQDISPEREKWRRELSCEKELGRKEKLFSNYSTPKTSTRAVDKILHNMILYHICQGHVMEMFIKYDGLSCAKQKMAAGNSLWP